MLRRESLYAFMGSISDYLLVVDRQERILHMNQLFKRDCFNENITENTWHLNHVLTPTSLNTYRSAMKQAQGGIRGVGVYTSKNNDHN